MFKQVIVAIVLAFLIGCQRQVVNSDVAIHPDWPQSIQSYQFDWTVVEVDGKIVVGLEYDDSLEFRLLLEDIKRYMKDTTAMICFYRKDLQELRCAEKGQ